MAAPTEQPTFAHLALQALPLPVAVVGVDGTIQFVNKSWRLAMSEDGDLDHKEPIGQPYLDCCELAFGPPKSIHEQVTQGFTRIWEQSTEHFTHNYTLSINDETRSYQFIISAIDQAHAVVLHQDLSSNSLSIHNATSLAKEREETLPRLAEHAPVLMWITNEKNERRWFNHRWLAFMQQSLDVALTMDWHERIHRDDYERVRETKTEAMQVREEYLLKYRLRRADGEYCWLQERGQPLYHHDGAFAGYIGSCTDITDNVRIEEDLARHRDHLHRQLMFAGALNRMSQALLGMDEQEDIRPQLLATLGQTVSVDQCVLLDVTATDQQVLVKQVWGGRSAPTPNQTYDLSEFNESLRHAWEMRTPIESHDNQVNPRFTSEGSAALLHQHLGIRSLLWLPFAFRNDGFLIIGIHACNQNRQWLADEREFLNSTANLFDLCFQKQTMLNERRLNAQQLLQVGKMEALGRLASGTAHDFNNHLTVINGHAALLQRGLDAGHPLRPHPDAIIKATEVAAETVRHLLSFSRQQPGNPEPIDPNKVIERLRLLLDRVIPEHITIQTDLLAYLGDVICDPGQLELVLMNLAINAKDAMPDGGSLTISTREESLDATQAKHLELKSGLYVAVSVRDTGIGMDEQTQKHLFEPFFTTKHEAGCSGLGLSTAYGAVRAMNGCILVNSQPGQGSTFTILLPKVIKDSTESLTPLQAPSLNGNETILLVEDNPIVLEITRDALRLGGYHVLTAVDTDEAVRIAQAHQGSIDLLLTDMVLPGLGGASLAVRLRAAQPSLRVVMTSGYAPDAFGAPADLVRDGFLAKPYTIDELMRTIRHALDTKT